MDSKNALIWNIIAKYNVIKSITHNFDKNGFIMGVISTDMAITSADRRSNKEIAWSRN